MRLQYVVSLVEGWLEVYRSTELVFRYKETATELKLWRLRGNAVTHPGLHNPPQVCPCLFPEEALEDV